MRDRSWAAIAALMLVVTSVTVPGWCENEQLTVVQDESSMERVIEGYLKANCKEEVQEKQAAEGDLALVVKMKGEGGPDFSVLVDTQASNRDSAGNVLERFVTVQVFTGVEVPEERRAAVFEALNKFQADSWYASIYIDEDKELSCQWCVNVMKQGMHTEYVADAIIRVAETWRKFRPQAEKALGGK